MTTPITLLLVEDSPADARLVQELLEDTRLGGHRVLHVETLEAALEAVGREALDIALLDLSLPDSRGLRTFHELRDAAPEMPIVVLTGLDDELLSLEALQCGAQDYLAKDHADRYTLNRAVRYAIHRNRAERFEAERRALEEAVKGMERVLAVVGHELRTPLFAFRLLLESMADGIDTGGRERTLKMLLAQAAVMSDTVTNVLEAARLDSGVAHWNWASFSLAELIEPALDLVQPLLETGVELTHAIEPPDARMRGDAEALRRLLINLLSNAAKHTPAGRIAVHADMVQRAEGLWARIRIVDSGRGIPANVLEKLGIAFALNAGVVGACSTGGTGLGLSICAAIAAAHGGRVEASSDGVHGSCFTVWVQPDRAGPAVPDRAPRHTRLTPPAPGASSAPPPRSSQNSLNAAWGPERALSGSL